ncbi:MAG: NAD(P)-dependent oxidoreductase, partial [Clostridiales bacterium]|nr:NAD(P)-dependent oxidoreductase [Clostridiales bacterium]
VIDISSVIVYGAAVSSGRWPIDKPLSEEDVPQLFPMAPRGPYDSPNFASGSCMKRITEELTTFYFQEYGMHVCSMRPGDVYGPLDTHINLLPVMLRCALAGKSLEIPNGGDHVDSHTYNKDIAEAIYSAFSAKTLKRSVYNITGGRNWSMSETADAVMKMIPGSVIKLGPGMFPNGFYGISYVRPPISIKAAQEEFGYKVTPLERGIKETAEWMKKNWDFVPAGYFDLLPDSWKVE